MVRALFLAALLFIPTVARSQLPVSAAPVVHASGRFVFAASTDGWIVKYDGHDFTKVAEARAGKDSNLFAVSSDGRYVAVASESPPGLAIFDAELRIQKTLPASSRLSAVVDAAPRRSFLVALRDAPELWEVSYDPKAEPIAEGVVHDFRLKEGTFVEGFLNPRRTKLEQPLAGLYFLAERSLVIGIQRDGRKALAIQLDVRRAIGTLEFPGRTQGQELSR